MAGFPLKISAAERSALTEAAGRVLAADVIAEEDVPPFSRSSVDGFAVVAADVRGATAAAPRRLQIDGEVVMGKAPPHALAGGRAMRVPTGGALPPGADGVVKIEDCEVDGATLTVLDGEGSEEHVTERAADVRRGQVLARRGTRLTPSAVGMLAGAGAAEISVFARPVVAVLVGGDELRAPGAPLREGEIRDINGIALVAALRAMGFAPRLRAHIRDVREELEHELRRALDGSDAVVISGGSSVGERDYTPAVVAAAGSPGVVVHGVRAKPGRPTLLAVIGEKPVIGLPGNPVSALVMLEVLAKPILLRLLDSVDDTVPIRARLAHRLERDPALEHRVPVRLTRGAQGVTAQPLEGTSAQMHALGMADALITIPEGMGVIDADAWVDAMPMSR